MYAVVRRDLEMPPGKLSAQAGHAYTESLFDCIAARPQDAERYRLKVNGGSKVTVYARDLDEMRNLARLCAKAGVPHALFTDEGHVMPPHFDGRPIVTALGIGPLTRRQARPLVKRLAMVP
jgi:PTH2 family peptidyl-tRNA hydrolase